MAFKKFGTVAAAAVLACLSMGANAGLVGSFAAFEGVTDARTIETLEDFGAPDGGPLGIFAGGGVGGTATLSGSGTSGATSEASSSNSDFAFGRHFGNQPNVFWDAGGEGFVIEFTQAITAFGFNAADVGDFRSSDNDNGDPVGGSATALKVCLSTASSLTAATSSKCEEITTDGNNNNQIFAGIYDSSANIAGYKFVLFISLTGKLDGQAFDNFVAAIATVDTNPNPTPEPAGLALVGLGLLGLASTRRRR